MLRKLFVWMKLKKVHDQPIQEQIRCTAMLAADARSITLLAEDGSEIRVDYAASAAAYHQAVPKTRKCIGDRDVLKKSFVFAGNPNVCLNLPNIRDFEAVRSAVQQAGYSTFDLT